MIDQVSHSATHNTAGDQRDIFVTCKISDFVPLTLHRYLLSYLPGPSRLRMLKISFCSSVEHFVLGIPPSEHRFDNRNNDFNKHEIKAV